MPLNGCYTKRALVLAIALLVSATALVAATKKRSSRSASSRAFVTKTPSNKPVATKLQTTPPKKTTARVTSTRRKRVAWSPWSVPSYADSTNGDQFDGDDPIVRHAAVDALGRLNGSVVVTEAGTGRVLTIVNQKVAFKSGFQPCSTVKIPVALAALTESIIDRTSLLHIYGRTRLDMTEALAKSNNEYFAKLGEKLGFERVSYYARLFGLGEKAGLDIEGEEAGILPSEVPSLGMGMMTSFGSGIYLTPLELSALVGAVANGGTLYYLQYPRTGADAAGLIPRVKRHLDISRVIPDITPGMMGAVDYGTARRIGPDHEQPIYGKTGTCTDTRSPTHLGWFGSFGEVDGEKLVVTVLLTGGKPVSGPAAAGVAGKVYHNLYGSYSASRSRRLPVLAAERSLIQ